MINKICIKNVKSINELNVELKEGLTLIYGDNGIGKSSFIEIGNLIEVIFNKKKYLTQMLNTNVKLTNITKGFIYDTYNSLGKNKEIILSLDGKVEDIKYKYEIEIGENDYILKEKFSIKEIEKRGPYGLIFERNKEDNKLKVHEKNKKLFSILNDYIETEIDIPITSQLNYIYESRNVKLEKDDEFILKIVNNISESILYFLGEERRISVGSEKLFLMDGLKLNDKDIDQKNNFYKNLELFEDFAMELDNSINAIFAKEIKVDDYYTKYDLFINKSYGKDEYEVPFKMESQGTIKFLNIFNIIMQIYTKRDKTIFVDEFDTHFHENLTNKILRYIKNLLEKKSGQLILSTHNVSILSYDFLNNKDKNILLRNFDNKLYLNNLANTDTKENNTNKYLDGKYGKVSSNSDIYWSLDE